MITDLKAKLIRGLVITLVSVAVVVGAYIYGRVDQGAINEAAVLEQELKGVKEYEDINREVRRMDESSLDNVLDYWMQ